ncbi:transposase [Candidatus Tisiphia endosymbiont of Sialis lutaria]|uniref:transposase n=1 Tax=Candidatus Tisiphia endosymbiont of Sialis lutaria TaxID=2029164 RepID=UPI00312CAFDE
MKKKTKTTNPSVEKVVSELLSQSNPSEIFGKDGIFQELKKQLVNKILEKEMESYIGYEKHSKDEKESGNRRNGSYEKTIMGLLRDKDKRGIINKKQSRFSNVIKSSNAGEFRRISK